MSNQLTRRLALLDDDEHRALLGQGLRGIERETLRVDRAGRLARTPHPPALGAALTHPQITTDYAEALLEFITPAENDIGTTLHKLDAIHRYAYTKLGDEMLWSESMPCELPAGSRDRHRLVRHLEHRHAQARVPARPGAALRQSHAVHRRHPLQLLAAGKDVAAVFEQGRRFRRAPQRPARLPVRELHRPDPQLPPLQLAADVPVRRLAGAVHGLLARPRTPARNAVKTTPCTCRMPPACA